MNLFKKKFNIRLDSHPFGYIIEYSEYRFFRIWSTLEQWVDKEEDDGDWEPLIFNATEAHELLFSINSMEDVKKFYKSIETKNEPISN